MLVQVLSPGPSVGLLVDCPVDCGKTFDWIWMPFGVVGRLGPRMKQVDRNGDRLTGRGNFGEHGTSHCNQLWRSFAKVHKSIELPFG